MYERAHVRAYVPSRVRHETNSPDNLFLRRYLVVVIVVSHFVWITEKATPQTNILARDYFNGVFDAIWAVSTGYFQVRACVRVCVSA